MKFEGSAICRTMAVRDRGLVIQHGFRGKRAVISVCPDIGSRAGIQQAGADPDPAIDAPDASLHHEIGGRRLEGVFGIDDGKVVVAHQRPPHLVLKSRCHFGAESIGRNEGVYLHCRNGMKGPRRRTTQPHHQRYANPALASTPPDSATGMAALRRTVRWSRLAATGRAGC